MATSKKPLRTFKVLAGTHDHGDRVYTEGELVKTPLDLVSIFPNKFEEVHNAPTFEVEETPPEEDSEGLGQDVTANFKGAKAAGYRVFERSGKFFVADEDTPLKALNDKPLPEKEVAQFIKAL